MIDGIHTKTDGVELSFSRQFEGKLHCQFLFSWQKCIRYPSKLK
jgi:hypothetical protein